MDDRVAALRLAERLRRLEQQISAFKELHATELQMILDELADIAREVEDRPTAAADAMGGEGAGGDPAANSPKRAKWLAEQERRKRPSSRREFLLGRGDEPPGG